MLTGFSRLTFTSISSDRTDHRTSDLQTCRSLSAKPRCFRIHTAQKSQPDESQHRQLPQVSLMVQPFSPVNEHLLSRKKAPWAPETFVLPLGLPGLWGVCYQVHESLCRPPELGCLLGNEGYTRKEQDGCKDPIASFRASSQLSRQLLGSEQLSLNPVSVHTQEQEIAITSLLIQ